MPETSYRVGDKVRVLGDAESCCAAEDAGALGEVIKVKRKDFIVVRSQAGEWAHCRECIELFEQAPEPFEK